MDSEDDDFEELRARYSSLKSSIESELRVIQNAPRPSIVPPPPPVPHVRNEQYYAVRDSVIGDPSDRPFPSVECAIDEGMSSHFQQLRTSVSDNFDEHPARPHDSATVSTPDRQRHCTSAAASPTHAEGNLAPVENGVVLLKATRPSCEPGLTMVTASDIASTNPPAQHIVPQCSNSQGITGSPRPTASSSLDVSEADTSGGNTIAFGFEAMKAALDSHRQHYLKERAALRPAGRGRPVELLEHAGHSRSTSRAVPISPLRSSMALRPSSAGRPSSARVTSMRSSLQLRTKITRTQSKVLTPYGTSKATPVARKVPLARSSSANATPRETPAAGGKASARDGHTCDTSSLRNQRQAEVLASMKHRSHTIYQNAVLASS